MNYGHNSQLYEVCLALRNRWRCGLLREFVEYRRVDKAEFYHRRHVQQYRTNHTFTNLRRRR